MSAAIGLWMVLAGGCSSNGSDTRPNADQTTREDGKDKKADAQNDQKMNDEIRRDLAATGTLKDDAKDVTVDTSAGHVTVKGKVANQDTHDQVLAVVHKYAVTEKIDDKLEVRTE